MIKIKILNSGLVKEVEDKSVCWDTGRKLMRIVDADVGDLIILTHATQGKDTVAEVLAKIATEDL